MSYSQKRKRASVEGPELHWLAANREDDPNDGQVAAQELCVEAHESDLLYRKEAIALALEAPSSGTLITGAGLAPSPGSRGSGLLKWEGGSEQGDIWVDRFDARLLLSCLPPYYSDKKKLEDTPGSPPSSEGWSDLPSDTEDAFFLSSSEIADIRHAKRRRLLENARTERLYALRAAGDEGVDTQDLWGGSDEEPDAAQTELMERTAVHLHSSPDRARLTARILANHGADKRFAFMRGRWRRAWTMAKAKALAAAVEEEEKKKKEMGSGLMALGDYGDSDDDQDDMDEQVSTAPESDTTEKAAKMEARRLRAREWSAKRRAAAETEGTRKESSAA